MYADGLRVDRVPIYLDVPDMSVAHKISRQNDDIFAGDKKYPERSLLW